MPTLVQPVQTCGSNPVNNGGSGSLDNSGSSGGTSSGSSGNPGGDTNNGAANSTGAGDEDSSTKSKNEPQIPSSDTSGGSDELEDSGKLGVGSLIGIIGGSMVGCCIIAAFAFVLIRKRSMKADGSVKLEDLPEGGGLLILTK